MKSSLIISGDFVRGGEVRRVKGKLSKRDPQKQDIASWWSPTSHGIFRPISWSPHSTYKSDFSNKAKPPIKW